MTRTRHAIFPRWYTDNPVIANSTVVKASHITELRNAVIAIE